MKYIAGLIIVSIIAAAGVVLATRDDNTNQPNDGNTQNTSTSPQSSPSPTPSTNNQQTSTNKVSISNFAFSPADITVKKGTTVTWTNNDSVAHSIKFETDDIPESSTLSNGQTYTHMFDDEGTFNYVCGIHSSMHGTVTVTE